MAEQGTVYVIDDDDSVRRSLGRLVRSAGLRSHAFSFAEHFLREPSPQRPACLVLDVRMPGRDGLDVQDELRRRGHAIPIVFITGHGTIPMTARAMKAGAIDFLEKPFDATQLLAAVLQAIERDRQQCEQAALDDEARERLFTLTPREREVLTLVVRGMLNKQTAAELGTCERTIKVHRARVMEKMGAESLPDLVRRAQRAGVSEPEAASQLGA